MNKLVRRGFLVVSILTVLSCLTFGMVLLMLPRQADMVSDYLFADAGWRFEASPPVRHPSAEFLLRRLVGPAAPGTSGPESGGGRWQASAEELNQQMCYWIGQKDVLARGVEQVQVRLGSGRVEVLCRIDARQAGPVRPPAAVPAVLAGPRTVYLQLAPYQDLAGRWCARVDHCRVDGLPAGADEVGSGLAGCWPGLRYEPEAGFVLPEPVRLLETTSQAIVLTAR